VKRFLKGDDGVKLYSNVKVTWQRGHPPVLKVRDSNDGREETIQLSGLTEAKLHALMEKKGFRKKTADSRRVRGGIIPTRIR